MKEPCKLLVFVRDTTNTPLTWNVKYWMTNECTIRAKNHTEELKDFADMKDFPICGGPRYKLANWKTFVKEVWDSVLESMGCKRK